MTIRILICAAALAAAWALILTARPAVAAALIHAQGGN